MTAIATDATTDPDPAPHDAPPKLRWWRELLIAGVFYGVYSLVRNEFGAGPESRQIAYRHAVDVIDIEKAVGLWFEPRLQDWYLSLPGNGLIRAWNVFYGTAHFAVTMGILVLAFRKAPQWYRFVRTMLAGATALALIGFAGFTLMPPRLLDSPSRFGACRGQAAGCRGYDVVDTVERWGGIWKFGQGKMSVVTNQYAAMPSMHFGWSTWCAITFVLVIGRGRARWLAFLYPAATLFCILVTGNHFWLDALFGAFALGGGALIAAGVRRATTGRTGRLARSSADPSPA
jgi:hypothetical protein